MSKFLSALVTVAMIMILGITFIQVAVRFVFHVSIGGWDEVPTYMMLLGIWLTAAVNVKNKDHIQLELFSLLVKNEKAQKIVQVIACLITIAAFIIFTVSLAEFTGYNFRKKAVTPGMSIPYWIMTAILMFSVILMIYYYIVQVVTIIKEVIKWK